MRFEGFKRVIMHLQPGPRSELTALYCTDPLGKGMGRREGTGVKRDEGEWNVKPLEQKFWSVLVRGFDVREGSTLRRSVA